VEDSVAGWVRFTYPAVYQGRIVEGVELTFEKGRVTSATASVDQEFLQKMIESDVGSHYLGEFAVGTNFEIDRFTRNILFDEKIGGTFHLAWGRVTQKPAALNTSVIHWISSVTCATSPRSAWMAWWYTATVNLHFDASQVHPNHPQPARSTAAYPARGRRRRRVPTPRRQSAAARRSSLAPLAAVRRQMGKVIKKVRSARMVSFRRNAPTRQPPVASQPPRSTLPGARSSRAAPPPVQPAPVLA